MLTERYLIDVFTAFFEEKNIDPNLTKLNSISRYKFFANVRSQNAKRTRD